MTARPTFEHHFGGHPLVTRIVLNRLGRESSISIIARLSNGKTLPKILLDEIILKVSLRGQTLCQTHLPIHFP